MTYLAKQLRCREMVTQLSFRRRLVASLTSGIGTAGNGLHGFDGPGNRVGLSSTVLHSQFDALIIACSLFSFTMFFRASFSPQPNFEARLASITDFAWSHLVVNDSGLRVLSRQAPLSKMQTKAPYGLSQQEAQNELDQYRLPLRNWGQCATDLKRSAKIPA